MSFGIFGIGYLGTLETSPWPNSRYAPGQWLYLRAGGYPLYLYRATSLDGTSSKRLKPDCTAGLEAGSRRLSVSVAQRP